MNSISVIIPSNHKSNDLIKIVHYVCQQNLKPTEIVIVNSNAFIDYCPKEITNLCYKNNINFLIK